MPDHPVLASRAAELSSDRALEFGHFKDGFQGAAQSFARAICEERFKKIKEAHRKAKQLGAITHHVNGGRPGRKARSRALR